MRGFVRGESTTARADGGGLQKTTMRGKRTSSNVTRERLVSIDDGENDGAGEYAHFPLKKSEEKGGKTDAFVLCIFRHIGGYFGPALSSSSSS